MTGWIGITLGDVTGIGPEVTLKALAALATDDPTRFLLIGDAAHLRSLNERLALRLPLSPYQSPSTPERFCVLDSRGEALPAAMSPGANEAAQAAVRWLREGAGRCRRGELDALVTAPVSKEAILRSGQPFVGQTEFLTELAGGASTAMMLLGQDDRGRWLRVALATTHVALRHVADRLKTSAIERTIELAAGACRDLGLPRARVAVCGLNPHAGEGGALGTEEMEIIAPAVRNARQRGVEVTGPLAADALFYHAYRGDFEAVVAMYHDQGLVPLKMIGFDTGINWTLGLPFIRTSPDHGTAYDIAGQGIARAGSMLAAIRLAQQLARA